MKTTQSGVDFGKVSADELRRISAQRNQRGQGSERTHRVGLALSGGGIRSASFALGVLQALVRHEKLSEMDYLSTVSGGGYIGASLTWFNYLQRVKLIPASSLFGHKGQVRRETAAATAPAPDGTAFIRQHGEYLTPSKKLTALSLLALAVRNSLIAFSVYFSLIVTAVLGLGLLPWERWASTVASVSGLYVVPSMLPAAVLAVVFVGLSVLFGWMTWIFPKLLPQSEKLYAHRIQAQRFMGRCFALTGAALIGGSIPLVHGLFLDFKGGVSSLSALTTTGLAGVIYQFIAQQRPKFVASWPRLNSVLVWVAGSALIYSVLMLAYLASLAIGDPLPAIWILLGVALLAGGLLNSNMSGLGRMYRDRLMEAFMPDPKAVATRRWYPAYLADVGFLKDVCTDEDVGPYHIVNTNVVLTSSDYASYRGRGGDNFILSPLYCGSDATGWHDTDKFCGGTLSLATAIAISGAAINPHTACGGQGPTRNRLASFMLSLFNVRLGYWVPNPHVRSALARWLKLCWPNLLFPGLRQGLLGSGRHTRASFLELTDGGHFDNTGIYELVRRRVNVIVLSLASADPQYGFDDLADVLERIRVDFGVFVDFPSRFGSSMPDVANKVPAGIGAALSYCKEGYTIGSISYPAAGGARQEEGILIVLRSATTLNLPMDVLRYAVNHRTFPNESTLDQFFDERQFEAYREAGYSACHYMLAENKVKAWF